MGETARPQAPPRTREWGHPCYDENGNLTGNDTQGLAYDSGNRLRQIGDVVFERDANGQTVRQTSVERDDRYEWDALGQMVRVRHRDGAETRFGYDAFGRRVFKQHRAAPPKAEAPDPIARFAWAQTPLPGEPRRTAETAPRHILVGRTEYFWAGDDLLAESRSSGLTEYAMWGFVAEALWEDGALRHVVNSQQGVPQELGDGSGRLVWQGVFDDWGKLVDERGKTTCRLRLPGQIADDETGLHYNRFRYYSPDAGQFVSADPAGFGGGSNAFRFAPNPGNWIDPLGLNCEGNACVGDPAALSAKLRSGELQLPDVVLYRTAKTGPKGRPYGSQAHPHPPSNATFNPRIYVVAAGDIRVGRTMHPTNERQSGPVSTLSNAELTRFRLEDPVSSRGRPGGNLDVTGGHHRLGEIERRVNDGTLPRDTPVRILLHD